MVKVLLTPHSIRLNRVFAWFLLEEARTRGGSLYIVSPWISNIKFDNRLIYLPYLDAENVLDALGQLASAGKNVFVVTRYYDDVLRPDVLYTWATLYRLYGRQSRGVSCPSELDVLWRELKDEVRFALGRIEPLEALLRMENIRVMFNNRVHAKLYVGERYAIIGSANLTTASAFKNEECVIVVSRDGDEVLYHQAREQAVAMYESASEEQQYERTFLYRLLRLRELGLRFDSVELLKEWLRELAA